MERLRRVGWPSGWGNVRRPVPILCMWLNDLDGACARRGITVRDILATPRAWREFLRVLRQNPVTWTRGADAPSAVPVTIDRFDPRPLKCGDLLIATHQGRTYWHRVTSSAPTIPPFPGPGWTPVEG